MTTNIDDFKNEPKSGMAFKNAGLGKSDEEANSMHSNRTDSENLDKEDIERMQKMKSIYRRGVADSKFIRYNNLNNAEMYHVNQPEISEWGNKSLYMKLAKSVMIDKMQIVEENETPKYKHDSVLNTKSAFMSQNLNRCMLEASKRKFSNLVMMKTKTNSITIKGSD